MNTIAILSISLLLCLILLYISNKYLKRKNGDIMQVHENAIYNGKDTNPSISSINNIGLSFFGDYRMDIANGSTVKYLFFCIFIPLIPVGCYRALRGMSENLGRQGAGSVNRTQYTIYGTEKWNFVEVLIIYLTTISIILALIIIINLWDYIF